MQNGKSQNQTLFNLPRLLCWSFLPVILLRFLRHQFKCGLEISESNTVKNWTYGHRLFIVS